MLTRGALVHKKKWAEAEISEGSIGAITCSACGDGTLDFVGKWCDCPDGALNKAIGEIPRVQGLCEQ